MRYQADVQLSLWDTTVHPEYGYLRIITDILITFEYSTSWKREFQLPRCSYVNCALDISVEFVVD